MYSMHRRLIIESAPVAGVLQRAAGERWSGRIVVSGGRSGWIDVDAGAITGAGRHGQATFVVRLAEESAFTAEEWESALRRRHLSNRWAVLAGGDQSRGTRFADRLRDDIVANVRYVASAAPATVQFLPGARHPFGLLGRWDALMVLAAAGIDTTPAPVVLDDEQIVTSAPVSVAAPYESDADMTVARHELLALLREVSASVA